ncbi:MAG TPA: agmatinase [Candidatus Kapabacteria bacterium]|nr:agmatinase [Candidatus Kapabacteria bacterium]
MKTLGVKSNFLAIEQEFSSFDNSAVAIVSAPYEHSTSYGKGASLGPKAIIAASAYVEFYDDEFDKEICFEKGIATITPLALAKKKPQAALKEIESTVTSLLESNKFVVTLGGEHTICTAPIKAHFNKYPSMSILHFDAHSDLRSEYQGSPYSHASALARVCDYFPPERLVQVGIRAQCKEEAEFIRTRGVKTFYASAIRRGLHGRNWQENIANQLGNEIYVTFDIDYFDPAIMPATGTPEPDGFLWSETMDIFRAIRTAKKKIIGFDVVEFAPISKLHHCDLTAARLVYKMLNFAFA